MSRRQARATSRAHAPVRPQAGRVRYSPSPLEQAQALLAAGDRTTAETLCRSILEREPQSLGAMSLLGIVLAETARTKEAAEFLGRVADRAPNDAAAQNNYGNVLKDLGRYGQALTRYERAAATAPRYAEAHYNRGVTLQELQRYEQALASYDKAVALEPAHARAWNNRGAALRALGRFEEAVDSHERATALNPRYAQAHNNLGVALQELRRLEQALAGYDRALAINPNYAEAHNNRAAALHKLNRLEEALASLGRALELSPAYAEAWNARGAVLKDLEQFEDALASYERALAINPNYAEAYSNRGSMLRALKRYPQALESFQRALDLDPSCVEAYRNQGAALIDLKSFHEALSSYERALTLKQDVTGYVALAGVLHELKRTEEAVECYDKALTLDPNAGFLLGTARHVRMQICDWRGFDDDLTRIVDGIKDNRPVARPFNVLSLFDCPRLQREASEIALKTEYSPRRKLPPLTPYPRHERIRIGYFSADLRNHAVAVLTSELFELHDRSKFEITAFSLGANVRDGFRARIEPAFDRFLWVGAQADREIAELARSLEIDIAVDLGGYTADARPNIMALRAAPLQVSYLGYLGTMGAGLVDYLVADPVVVPPEAREHYAEKIAYLPSYQVNDSKRIVAERTFTRAELGLPQSGFVYCCFNASYKITPEVFASWMRILTDVPGSVLWLLGGDASKEHNLRERAADHGVSAERLIFGGRVGNAEYLARYRTADLFLDTQPYNAGTTASDALWVGLPVLTCLGKSFAARVAASVLTAAGLPDLISVDRSHYERLAVQLATDPNRLAEIRERLAQNRTSCALFDTPKLTRNIEAMYERMYERHRAGEPPEDLHSA